MNGPIKPETFHVMQSVEGDDVAIAHRQTFEAAEAALIEASKHCRATDLSIWSSRGLWFAFVDRRTSRIVKVRQ
jgi:hypothetical protein